MQKGETLIISHVEMAGIVVEYPDGKGRSLNGSPIFYDLLKQMMLTHDAKSYDYASNSDPVTILMMPDLWGELVRNYIGLLILKMMEKYQRMKQLKIQK
jgi:hypothetical protein